MTAKLPKPRKPRKIKKTERQLRIEEAVSQEPALYEGLTPQEQLAKARAIRGVGRLPKGLQSLYKAPTEDEWRNLALVCVKAIVQRVDGFMRSDRVSVEIRLPYFYREYAKDFPIGTLLRADTLTQTFRVNANKLLDYISAKGYTSFTSRELRKNIGAYTRELSQWDNEFTLLSKYAPDYVILEAWENLEINDGE